jgi:hypothetical protein
VRERSFESVVRRKVLLAVAPLGGLLAATVVAVGLSRNGYSALAVMVSLGASWVAFVFRDEIFHGGDNARNYVTGRQSERTVQDELDQLRSRCFVRHDVSLPFGGNIDHVVCGATGAFAVETKTSGYLKRDLPTARRRAKWLSTQLDSHWVTPVICLVNREQKPFEHDRVWVMGLGELREWLEGRRGRPLDPVFALRVLGA